MDVSPFAISVAPASTATSTLSQTPRDDAAWQTAQKFESVFLTEMLTHAGFGKTREAFGGGVGEDQFSSLLVAEQANAMTKAGGIGLAETLYKAIAEKPQ